MTTENLTVEGDGAGTQPTAPVSQPAIEGADSLSKLLDAKLTEALKPLLGEIRGVQGKADRLDKSQREFLEEYDRQKAAGKSTTEAERLATEAISDRTTAQKRDAAIDLLLRKEGLLPNGAVGNGDGGAGNADRSFIAQAVTEAELPADDPRVAEFLRGQYRDADHALAEAVRLKKKMASPPPNPSAVSPQGSPPPPAPDAKAIEAKMVQLNKMYKNPSAHKKEIPALEKELEAYLPK